MLAANERPSINDVTARELRALLPRVAKAEIDAVGTDVFKRALDENRLAVVSSGSDLPVIDLTHVSSELRDAARGADLVVLEGMGRAVETNLFARFACDALNLGMVKHPEVAQCLRGELYDCVCRFRRPERKQT